MNLDSRFHGNDDPCGRTESLIPTVPRVSFPPPVIPAKAGITSGAGLVGIQNEALHRKRQIKRWPRKKKLALIHHSQPK